MNQNDNALVKIIFIGAFMSEGVIIMRRYIQTIALYEDSCVTEKHNQRILINPISAFVLETGTEHLTFNVVLSIINVPKGTVVKSSFSKIENQTEIINSSEEDISRMLEIKGINDLASGIHTQMLFDVEADAEGFGFYVIKVSLELNGEILEEDGIIIPIKKGKLVNE